MHPRTGWGDHSGLLSRSCSAGKDGVLFAFHSLVCVVQRLSRVLGQLRVLFLGVRAYLWEHVGVARGLNCGLGLRWDLLCVLLSLSKKQKHNSMRSHVHVREHTRASYVRCWAVDGTTCAVPGGRRGSRPLTGMSGSLFLP